MTMHEWVVGLDLRPHSQGAIEFAKWLHSHDSTSPGFRAVHVMEDAAMRVALRLDSFPAVLGRAEETANSVGAKHLDTAQVSVLRGTTADKILAEAVQLPGTRGLIIGRRAKRNEQPIVMLGRVARRLLRSLPAPVFVIPPDLRADELGDGPILVAVDTDDASVAAVTYARQLATDLGRAVELVHVMPMPEFWGEPYAPAGRLEAAREDVAAQIEPEVRAWLKEHGMDDLKLHLRQGYVITQLAEVASEVKAPVLACGSRHLSLAQRWFRSSVATGISSISRTPVAVIPQTPQES
jgi:nucleotide-binding universal stress UspA family protein